MKRTTRIYVNVQATVALCATVACTHSNEPARIDDDRHISFEVETNSFSQTSRAEGITTTENIPEFKIWAYDTALFAFVMQGVTAVRTGINSWSYSPAADWTGNPINFTAVSPASVDININPWWVDMIRYQNKGDQDLVVCRRTNVVQTSGRLKLHFYHALAMVDVVVRPNLPDGKVVLKSVTMVNVNDVGEFHYPPEGFNAATTAAEVSECWNIYPQSLRIPVFFSENGTALPNASAFAADNQGYDFFIPSYLTEFNFDAYFNTTYLEIDYRLENDHGATIWPNASTDYRLVSDNNPGYGQLRLGLSTGLEEHRWLAGKRYRYNVAINGPAEVPPGAASDNAPSAATSLTLDIADSFTDSSHPSDPNHPL